MSVTTTTHVNFRGQAREALEFYRSVFGGDISLATYTDIHAVEDPAQAQQVAFGRLDAPSGFALMAYDVQPSKGYDPGTNPFYITLQGTDGAEIQPLWNGLAADAQAVLIPLAPAPFAPLYGMLTDRYGVTWIVGVDTAPSHPVSSDAH
ncbi:VOC family protein [Petropleomorpha daqingensis]|uniref:PhnB protein n=1 Tax=Petropleomorpha daqingensis TaxID=2026353 RepID=A0A853CJH3_9ACTN|nr:VOC family protein [Petropleomorpha daqingensis]NYJ06692.1 PhnB protein [Petropleomorpha daqingensis]